MSFGGGGGGGVAARPGSGSSRRCSAFRSAVDAGDMERGGMGWSGSCGSVGCWWACGRGAVAASRCRMAGRMSKSSSQQWAGAHALSGEAGGGVLRSGVR